LRIIANSVLSDPKSIVQRIMALKNGTHSEEGKEDEEMEDCKMRRK
jgi:hypothetical protein